MEHLKLVVVGSDAVGKSYLLIRATSDSFPNEFPHTVYTQCIVDGTAYSVTLWDTARQEEYERLRRLSYPQTDAFLVCFDTANRFSFESVTKRWIPEVRGFTPDTPILLVGNKTDLRSNTKQLTVNQQPMISEQEGVTLAASLGVPYKENGALDGTGVSDVIDTAIQLAANHRKSQKSKRRFGFFKKRSSLPLAKTSKPT